MRDEISPSWFKESLWLVKTDNQKEKLLLFSWTLIGFPASAVTHKSSEKTGWYRGMISLLTRISCKELLFLK